MVFNSIFTSAVQCLVDLFAVSAVTEPAENRTIVNVRFGWCCWFGDILAKHNNTLDYFPQLGGRHTRVKTRGSVYTVCLGSTKCLCLCWKLKQVNLL